MSVLLVRRREEAAALGRFANAMRARADAEGEEARQIANASAARQRYDNARTSDVIAGGSQAPAIAGSDHRGLLSGAASTKAHARFVARRRDELARAEAKLEAWRSGTLAETGLALEIARTEHIEARRAREALDKHQAKYYERERSVAGRRDEDVADDVAQAARYARGVRRES